jgi:ribonucleotide reductase alpha subunit
MFIDPFQEKIWRDKYQYSDETYEGFCERISGNIFPNDEDRRDKLKYFLMSFKVLFGGRINSNIGTSEQGLTLFNCFIEAIPKNPDSMEGIMSMLSNYVLTLKTEGGVGFCADFLRPARTIIRKIGVSTPGSVKFLELFDKASEIITSGSVDKYDCFQGIPTKKSIRKGATMVTMSCNHPDIEDFITAKAVPNKLTKMNMSVMITDSFMHAVENNLDWELWFPDINFERYDTEWDGNFNKWVEKDYPIVVYKVLKAVDLWDLLLKNSYLRNEPGVIFIDNARRMNNLQHLNGDMISTNPCSEIFGHTGVEYYKGEEIELGDVCCLGSINLTKFYDVEEKSFCFDEFREAIDIMVRALDNVIDISGYPLPMYENAARLKRKIGVGLMGIGSLMMMMNTRYGSNECLYILDSIMSEFINQSYQSSAMLANEKGPFELYSPEIIESGYIKNGVLSNQTIEMIREYGLRNSALSAIAPTGCLVDSTMIPTNVGCIEMNDTDEISSRTSSMRLASDFGDSNFNGWYDKGYSNTISVSTHHGYSIEGTLDHKVRVISSGNGYIWKSLSDLSINDIVVLKKDFLFDKNTWINEDVAELIGFYMADGWFCGNRLYFQINTNEESYIKELISRCFVGKYSKIIVRDRDDSNSLRIEVNSKKIRDWFDKYNCVKDGSCNAFIPKIIMCSSRSVIYKFIKGFFIGDGGFNKSKENIKFTTVSDRMAVQLHTILLGIGIPSHLYKENNVGESLVINEKVTNSNYIVNRIELSVFNSRRLCDIIGVSSDSIDKIYEGKNFEPVVLLPSEYSLFCDENFIKKYKEHSIICVTDYQYKMKITNENYNWFVCNNLYLDTVVSKIESKDLKHVQDFSVSNTSKTYVANGFITHNTLSIVAGNISGGIEPVFAREFTRWNRVEGKGVDFDYPKIHKGEWFETEYLKEHKVADEVVLYSIDSKYRVDKNSGLCEKITIKDYGYKIAEEFGFTETSTAMELNVTEHLNVLKLVSSNIDQSASKTINLPSDITFESFKDLYGSVYKHGIKGCTTYREGTSVAVLETQKKEKEKSIKKQQKEFLETFKEQENGDVIAHDVQLPDEYPAKGYILKSEGGKKFYLHVAFKDKACTRPFAVFVNTNNREDNVLTFNALEKLEEIAIHKGINEYFIEETKKKYAYQKNPVKICRMLGLLLRHNVDVFTIVKGLSELEAIVGTFVFHINKFLCRFVGEHDVVGMTCPECGEKSIRFYEGCISCSACTYSRCG